MTVNLPFAAVMQRTEWSSSNGCSISIGDQPSTRAEPAVYRRTADGRTDRRGSPRPLNRQADDESVHHGLYLYQNVEQTIWPYDERGRLKGEDVWEPEPGAAELIKLDLSDVLTTEEAARLLAPSIKPLPSYDVFVAGRG